MPVIESRDLVSVSRRVSRPIFWSLRSRLGLSLEGSRSRALRLETLHRSFFMKLCKKEFLKKTVLKNHCSKFRRSKNVCEVEKTICPLPRLKFMLNSIKNVRVPMKPQHVISATRGWQYFAKDYL